MKGPEHPCEGLSRAARQAFDRIASGAQPRSSDRTLADLSEAGLVERHTIEIATRDRFGPIVRYEYSVPIAMHMRWCEWMTRPKRRTKRRATPPQKTVDGLPLFGLSNPRSSN